MRPALFVLILVSGCNQTRESSAPTTDVTPVTTSSASATPVATVSVSASASASATPSPEAPVDLSLGIYSFPRALTERLAKEWNAVPAGRLNLHPAPDAQRDEAIKKRFGEQCRLERTCGPLWGIDCQAAVDGPYFYVRVKPATIESITTCGGACMGGRCTNCPPKNEGWTCPTY